MRHLVILNPVAGKSDSTLKLAAEAEKVFSELGLSYSVEMTQYAGHAKEIALSAAKSGEEITIYACGGDGTISEAAQALYNAPNVTLAPVPVGTGNDFVRTITGGSGEKYSLTEIVKGGQTVSSDMILAGGKVAINIVSVGLDAQIAKNVFRYKRLPFVSGSMAYNISTAINFCTKVSYSFDFEVDGVLQPKGDVVFALAANGVYYGGGFKAAPIADIQDGLMDFIRIPALPRIRLLPMISRYKKGEHLDRYDFIKCIRCKKVRILSPYPVALNCDGEIEDVLNPVIEIVPNAMKLQIPAKYAKTTDKTAVSCE